MDTPFSIDWDVLAQLLATIIVLAFFVERALAILFEHRWYVDHLKGKGLSEPIAFGVSFLAVRYWEFDALSVLFDKDEHFFLGYVITAAIVAGGSKASIKLFHDIFKAKSTALRQSESQATR